MEKLQRSFVVIAQFYYPDLMLFICCYKGLSSLTSRFCYKSLNVTVLLITKSLMTSNLYDHILSSLLEPPKRVHNTVRFLEMPHRLCKILLRFFSKLGLSPNNPLGSVEIQFGDG